MKYANITEKPEDIKLRLLDFMEKSVYPNEHNYSGYLKNAKDRFSAVPLVEELKTKAKELGLDNQVSFQLADYREINGEYDKIYF